MRIDQFGMRSIQNIQRPTRTIGMRILAKKCQINQYGKGFGILANQPQNIINLVA